MARSILSLVFVLLHVAWLPAADLASIERVIKKEPAYAGKPKYCLLVFGPEAKTRIWLALDGDKLYVDKNGNGDLTDDGPAVEAKVEGEKETVFRSYEVSEIREGPLVHTNLRVEKYPMTMLATVSGDAREFLKVHPDSTAFKIVINVEMPGHTGAAIGGRVLQLVHSSDTRGFLQFSGIAREAPIVHFRGPLSVLLTERSRLMIGRSVDIYSAIGTAGLGDGTTAYVEYEKLVPATVHPVASISFPSSSPGAPSVLEHFELKERC